MTKEWQQGYATAIADVVRTVGSFCSLNFGVMGKTAKENLLEELQSLAPRPDYPEECFWKGCHKPRVASESFCDEHLPASRKDYKP